MLKLLTCLISGLLIAAVVMQLRQQRLDLSYQNNKLHNQIEARQAKLWNQQLRIAALSAPRAVIQNVGQHQLDMVPATPLMPNTLSVIEAVRGE